ncbi:MAG TPA: membrane protein insertase YidC [Arenimonas sp.]|nr:membrane protein insertase YidC [Arenimonas sp.]
MNQTRTFLLIAWLTVALLLFMEWGKAPESAVSATATASDLPATAQAPAPKPSGDLPPLEAAADGTAAAATSEPATLRSELLTIRNEVLALEIDTRGGRLVGAELLQYPLTKTPGSANVRLLDNRPGSLYHADAGLLNARGEALSSEALFAVESQTADALVLRWQDPGTGLVLRKHFHLAADSYVLNLRQEIGNPGTQAQVAYRYSELSRQAPATAARSWAMTDPEAYSFVGAAWYSPGDLFEKRSFADFQDDGRLNKDVNGGWIALLQHHFLTAWVPQGDSQHRFQLDWIDAPMQPLYRIRAVAAVQVDAGAETVDEAQLWIGPKLQEALDELAPTLKLSVDYGWLTFLSQPVFDWLLSPFHALTGNWGWAIVLTVLLLKIILYPLATAQYKSFAKLRAVQPRIEALKERYGDDKQKFQMAMMELYKKEKINPIGGCLPILLTFPVFIALYWVLLESVELRHAPWIGWISNLTAPDPYFVLPAINLLVMWLTQKMTPAPGMDPLQRKMMMAMPLVFGVMFAFFPSGLVLYWCTNGVLGLAQQWWITRQHGDKPATAK